MLFVFDILDVRVCLSVCVCVWVWGALCK